MLQTKGLDEVLVKVTAGCLPPQERGENACCALRRNSTVIEKEILLHASLTSTVCSLSFSQLGCDSWSMAVLSMTMWSLTCTNHFLPCKSIAQHGVSPCSCSFGRFFPLSKPLHCWIQTYGQQVDRGLGLVRHSPSTACFKIVAIAAVKPLCRWPDITSKCWTHPPV